MKIRNEGRKKYPEVKVRKEKKTTLAKSTQMYSYVTSTDIRVIFCVSGDLISRNGHVFAKKEL